MLLNPTISCFLVIQLIFLLIINVCYLMWVNRCHIHIKITREKNDSIDERNRVIRGQRSSSAHE